MADVPESEADVHGDYGGVDVEVSVTTTTGGEGAVGETGGAGSNSSAVGCSRRDGSPVECWAGDYWWSSGYQAYCKVLDVPVDSPDWDSHRDASGNPVGTFYTCLRDHVTDFFDDGMRYWSPDSPSTPGKAGTDPVTVVRTAVASLHLHPPTVGVGAYVYPDYEEWGLSWWVGAPMWLWVDASDPLQWGTHTISATEGGLTVTATVSAKTVSFDPGNGDDPIVCVTAGTPRPWNPHELLSKHSPSGCEHTYLHTNELGNINSRYTVSATVDWEVVWSSSDGQAGSFTTDIPSTESASIHVGQLRIVAVAPPT
ncbi:MAG: hypothetical protein LBI33_01040 [Propionibacteriaceae bacterium]|nr:hypothetical protein [Propionibacteriaceae bacterium]